MSDPAQGTLTVVEEIVARWRDHQPGPLLRILHGIQDRLGHVPGPAVPVIAQALNLSRAEVHGVISFYHDFRDTPPGRCRVRVCQAEACQSMGSRELSRRVEALLGVAFGRTRADGAYTLDKVYCLGNCACAPSVMIDDRLHGRVTAERFEQLLASREATR